MAEAKLRVVVIDDDDARKKNIQKILPEYLEVSTTAFGNSAKELIKPTADGRKCNLVIMNADDRKGQALYIFDWMKGDEEGLYLDMVPVLLLVEDEFSDRVLSFLEIGDAKFYEGAIDPDEFFLMVTSILNEAEFMLDPELAQPSYTEKSSDRISGMSIKPEGEDENTVKRSVVFNDNEQIERLNAALERGRKKQELIREIMQAAINLKEENAAANNRNEHDIDMDDIDLGEKVVEQPKSNVKSLYNLDAQRVSEMLDETLAKYEEPTEEHASETQRTIVVVDADVQSLKMCELCLNRRYNVVLLNSGMSAIDYFVKNRADLLLISYSMPYIEGVRILESIRWQPNGKMVSAIFMAEGNLELIKPQCRRERVVGMLQKPISPTAIKQAVEAVFAGMR